MYGFIFSPSLHSFSFSPAHTSNICQSLLVFSLSRVCIYSVSVKPAMVNGSCQLSFLSFENAHTEQCESQSKSIQLNPIKIRCRTLLQHIILYLRPGQLPKPCHLLLPLPKYRYISQTTTLILSDKKLLPKFNALRHNSSEAHGNYI